VPGTTVEIKTFSGAAIGKVELRWSTECHTNWARVTSYNGTKELEAKVVRPGDGFLEQEHLTSGSIYTNMVYGQGLCAYAWGKVYGAPWDTGEATTPTVC
jgi:hypothetical protein